MAPAGRLMRLFAIVFAVAASLYALPAQAQEVATATAEAQIIPPSDLIKTADLRFGRFLPGASGGTIRIQPNGTVTRTGTVTLVPGATRGPAAFYFTRAPFSNWPSYGGPNGTATLLITNIHGDTMLVRNFETDFNFTFLHWIFTTNYAFRVGATLQVGANQPYGHYEGEFTVTVDNL
jgi:hypothetical protein